MSNRPATQWMGEAMRARVAARYRTERAFKAAGLFALALAVFFLVFLLFTMMRNGISGFWHEEVRIEVALDAATLEAGADRAPATLRSLNYPAVLARDLARLGPDAALVVSDNAWVTLRRKVVADPSLIGRSLTVWVPAASNVDQLAKGRIPRGQAADRAAIPAATVAAYDRLKAAGATRSTFNTTFATAADSTSPETAGVWGAFVGSLLTLAVTLAFSFPVGVLAAIYLEEYAPRNRLTDLIEVSINNLAAVPSIIFGLLGLAVFLNTFGMPRSAPIVGGLTLALMTLPVIVIASRIAIKSVPPSIKDAALGIGASKVQVVFQHIFPIALPGILTGTIIGMARALGETAPLLMIGMRAFIVDTPHGFSDAATVLPVQIYLWSDEVNRGFVEKTSAAIIVLLVFLLMMNGLAIYLRNKFERRW